jgi:hypothetical protein
MPGSPLPPLFKVLAWIFACVSSAAGVPVTTRLVVVGLMNNESGIDQ